MQNIPQDTPATGMLRKSIRGGGWLTVGYFVEKFIGTFSFFILARLLAPADFGIMSVTLLVPKLFQTISEPGFANAIIQTQGDVSRYLNPIWTVRILKSLAIALAVFACAPWIAAFFHVQYVTNAIRLGGVFIFIQNLSNIGEIYLYKQLDFKKWITRNIAKQLAYMMTATIAAAYLHSYWALMLGTAALYITEAGSTYFLHPYRPWFSFQFGRLKDLMNYSKWIFSQGIVDQIYGSLENTIVGRVTNINSVGFYTKAKSLAGSVPGLFSAVVSFISFPAYARLKNAPEKIRDGFLKSMDIVSFVTIPTFLVIATGGKKLILIFLGAKWLPMAEALWVLIIYFSINIIIDISYELFNGMGYPDKKIKIDAGKILVTTILLFVLTTRYGIVGTSWALLLGLVPPLVMSVHYLRRYIGLRKRDIIRTTAIPLLACAFILTPLLLFKSTLVNLPTMLFVLVLVLAGIGYFIIIIFFGKKYHLGPLQTLEIIRYHILPQ